VWPNYWPLWIVIGRGGRSGQSIDHRGRGHEGLLPIKGPDFHCFGALVHPLTFSTLVLLFKEILETLQWLSAQEQTTLDPIPQDFSLAQVRFKPFTNRPKTKPSPKVSVLYTLSYKNIVPQYLLTITHWLIYCLDKPRPINTSHQNQTCTLSFISLNYHATPSALYPLKHTKPAIGRWLLLGILTPQQSSGHLGLLPKSPIWLPLTAPEFECSHPPSPIRLLKLHEIPHTVAQLWV
jgi:hypothetical protein